MDPTFLKDLQRNINVHPYDFYSLVAESTVVVQHLASAVIFVTSFVAMYIEVVSPVSVVAISTLLTVAGWAVWDMGLEKREAATERSVAVTDGLYDAAADKGLGLEFDKRTPTAAPPQEISGGSYFPPFESSSASQQNAGRARSVSDRDHSKQVRKSRVLATAKSALLIYCK